MINVQVMSAKYLKKSRLKNIEKLDSNEKSSNDSKYLLLILKSLKVITN